MSLASQIDADMRTAMKAGETQRLGALRLLRAQLFNEALAKKVQELSDADVHTVIRRELKKRTEAADAFRKGGREESAVLEEAEAQVLRAYLPAELSDGDIEEVVKRVLATGDVQGPAAMGNIMRELKGKADGARVREVFERLSAGT